MKKIILVGNRCEETQGLFFALSEHFQVKLCTVEYDMFQGLKKVFKPDLVVFCFVNCLKPDSRLLGFIEDRGRSIPVLTVGIEMMDAFYSKTHTSSGMIHLNKKVSIPSFLQQVSALLGLSIHSTNKNPTERKRPAKPLILVVDDFAMLLRQVRTMLKEKYEVEIATNGVQAMSSIGRMKPDLILLDYAMPVYDGKKVFEVLKMSDETKDIPVVFLTGVADNDRVEEILSLKPAGYLLKPPNKDRLNQIIENVLASKQRVHL